MWISIHVKSLRSEVGDRTLCRWEGKTGEQNSEKMTKYVGSCPEDCQSSGRLLLFKFR